MTAREDHLDTLRDLDRSLRGEVEAAVASKKPASALARLRNRANQAFKAMAESVEADDLLLFTEKEELQVEINRRMGEVVGVVTRALRNLGGEKNKGDDP